MTHATNAFLVDRLGRAVPNAAARAKAWCVTVPSPSDRATASRNASTKLATVSCAIGISPVMLRLRFPRAVRCLRARGGGRLLAGADFRAACGAYVVDARGARSPPPSPGSCSFGGARSPALFASLRALPVDAAALAALSLATSRCTCGRCRTGARPDGRLTLSTQRAGSIHLRVPLVRGGPALALARGGSVASTVDSGLGGGGGGGGGPAQPQRSPAPHAHPASSWREHCHAAQRGGSCMHMTSS